MCALEDLVIIDIQLVSFRKPGALIMNVIPQMRKLGGMMGRFTMKDVNSDAAHI